MKDNHLFSILNEQLKTLASKANGGAADNLLKHMAGIKWSAVQEQDKIIRLEDVDEVNIAFTIRVNAPVLPRE